MSLVPQKKTLSNPLATHITNLYNNSTKLMLLIMVLNINMILPMA